VIVVAAFESPAIVAGLDDVTVMGQPAQSAIGAWRSVSAVGVMTLAGGAGSR